MISLVLYSELLHFHTGRWKNPYCFVPCFINQKTPGDFTACVRRTSRWSSVQTPQLKGVRTPHSKEGLAVKEQANEEEKWRKTLGCLILP